MSALGAILSGGGGVVACWAPQPRPALMLSQIAARSGSSRALIASGLLIAMVVILGLIVLHMRRRLLTADQGESGPGLLLDDLRAMRRRGEISDQEFEHMKKRVVERLSGTIGAHGSEKPRPTSTSRERPPDPLKTADRGAENRAPPGYDLTGDKLPKPHDGG